MMLAVDERVNKRREALEESKILERRDPVPPEATAPELDQGG
jgi:hypothetical protein